MDRQKLTVLRQIGYVIPPQCGNCSHAVFKKNNDFGSCNLFLYEHGKHTEERSLSVYRGGHCDRFFNLSSEAEEKLGDWKQFQERRAYSRSNRHKAKTRY